MSAARLARRKTVYTKNQLLIRSAYPLPLFTLGIYFPSDLVAQQLQLARQGYNAYNWPEASQQLHYALSLCHQWPLIIALPLLLSIHLMEERGGRGGVGFLSRRCRCVSP